MQETYRFLLLGRFKVAANKNQTIFAGWAQDTGKWRKQGIFWLQEHERNALPNLRHWLTTPSRIITR